VPGGELQLSQPARQPTSCNANAALIISCCAHSVGIASENCCPAFLRCAMAGRHFFSNKEICPRRARHDAIRGVDR
jgi:hypothetical protein